MTRLKISVVVATYNGEKYIIEQLQSILDQTVQVDEVLIFDDQSTDLTSQLCREFIDTNKLANWNLTINKNNLGFSNNFFNGFNNATGDIIFISDQDDVWEKNKVEVMLPTFNSNSSILSLATTFSRYNQDMELLCRHVNFHHRRKKGIKSISISEFCHFNSYMGMSMAFRKKLLNLVDDYLVTVLTFDRLLNTLAVINGGLYFLDAPLVRRRSYSNSVSNNEINANILHKYNNNRRLYRVEIEHQNIVCIKTVFLHCQSVNQKMLEIIENYITLSRNRAAYISNAALGQWIYNIEILKHYTPLTYIIDGFHILTSKFR